MKVDTLANLISFIDDCADAAVDAADDAGLVHNMLESIKACELPHRFSKSASLSLVQHEDYKNKDIYFCEKAWGVILSVDMRDSTKRAMNNGARSTFITMHVYMRAMIRLVARAKGIVVGLRGDGLLALFGRKTYEEDEDLALLTSDESDDAIRAATSCGDAMVKAVRKAINPALEEREIPADVRVGIGIESGKMVITKIGLLDAHDVTAYGHCVNRAANISSEPRNIDKVLIGRDANRIFPSGKGGRIQVTGFATDMFNVKYPDDSNTLK